MYHDLSFTHCISSNTSTSDTRTVDWDVFVRPFACYFHIQKDAKLATVWHLFVRTGMQMFVHHSSHANACYVLVCYGMQFMDTQVHASMLYTASLSVVIIILNT